MLKKIIIFFYQIPKLINRIEVEILVFLQKIKDDEGLPDFEVSSPGAEDTNHLTLILKEAASIIYGKIFALWGQEFDEEPFQFDVTYDNEGSSVLNALVLKFYEPENYNSNIRQPLDNAIERYLIYYTVCHWLFKNNLDGSYCRQLYMLAMDDIEKYTTYRKTYKRTYKLY